MKALLRGQPPEIIKAIDDIAQGIDARETVVFCGAGISCNSGLPVVNQLIPYILLTLCSSGKEFIVIEEGLDGIADTQARSGELIKKISTLMEVPDPAIQKVMTALPFEAFIEILSENSQIDKVLDIYDADSYMPHIEPNTDHAFLSKLIAAGKVKTIVTTNFDQLIEKALKSEGLIEEKDFDVVYRLEEFEKINWAQDRIRLVKLHGSIHDKQAMAITLRQVAQKELSEGRANIIRYLFAQGNHKQVLILGYSCSDVFDLSPQIEALKGSLKRILLVQHSGVQGVEDIRKREIKNPFKAFENGKRLYLNTDHIVQVLWELTIPEPYSATKDYPANWQENVDGWYAEFTESRKKTIKPAILGQLFNAVAEWRTVINLYESSLADSREYYDNQSEGIAFQNMGIAYSRLGNQQKAVELYEKAVGISRRLSDMRAEGQILENMGIAYMSLGEYQKAIEFYEKALEINRRRGDVQGEGGTLNNMGIAYMSLGEYQKAIELYEKALEISRRFGNVRGEGYASGNLGLAYMCLGEHQKAIEIYEETIGIAQRLGDSMGEGAALGNIGNAFFNLGEYQKAIEYCEKDLEIARRIGDMRGEGSALGNIGNAYMELGDYRKAMEFYEKDLEITGQIGNMQGEGNVLGNIGIVYMNLGKYEKAIEYCETRKGTGWFF